MSLEFWFTVDVVLIVLLYAGLGYVIYRERQHARTNQDR